MLIFTLRIWIRFLFVMHPYIELINYIQSISYCEKELAFAEYHIDIKGYPKSGPYNITKLYIIFLLIYVIINKDFADFMRTNYSNIYKLPSSHTFACNIVVAFAR